MVNGESKGKVLPVFSQVLSYEDASLVQ